MASTSIRINNIDNAGPTYVSGGRVSLGSFTAATFSDVSTPVRVYYYVTTSSGTPSAGVINSTSRTFSYSCGNTYYVWARAVDGLGNTTVMRLGSVYGGACCSVGTYRYDYCNSRGYEVESRYNECTGRTEYRTTNYACESDEDCESWGSCRSSGKKYRTCYYYYGGREYDYEESKRCNYDGGGSSGGSGGGGSSSDDKPDRYESTRVCSNKANATCKNLGYPGGGSCDLNSNASGNSVCGDDKWICYCCRSRDYLGQKIEYSGGAYCKVV